MNDDTNISVSFRSGSIFLSVDERHVRLTDEAATELLMQLTDAMEASVKQSIAETRHIIGGLMQGSEEDE